MLALALWTCHHRVTDIYPDTQGEMEIWNNSYNENPSPVNWQFTTQDAKLKLRHLYPDINKYRNERNERRLKKIQKLDGLQE